MSEVKTYRLFITPQTHVRVTKNELWIPANSDEYLLSVGQKLYKEKLAENKNTKYNPKNFLYRKREILKYYDYKRALKAEADKQGFIIPEENVWFKFYFPMARSWSQKKRDSLCFTQHKNTPDIDNISKGIFDSLLKSDKALSDYRASKFWYDGKEGYIEIEVGGLQPAVGYKKIVREDKIK